MSTLHFSPPDDATDLYCPKCGKVAFQDMGCTVAIERIGAIPGFSKELSDKEPIALVVRCECGAKGVAPLIAKRK